MAHVIRTYLGTNAGFLGRGGLLSDTGGLSRRLGARNGRGGSGRRGLRLRLLRLGVGALNGRLCVYRLEDAWLYPQEHLSAFRPMRSPKKMTAPAASPR